MKKACKLFAPWQLIAFSMVTCSLASANPSDPVVMSGSAHFENSDANTLSITTSDQAVIQWRDFSIAEHEMAKFVQPSAQSVVINKVTSELSSALMGSLKANGKVFLINPNGVLIGENGSIDTNGFIASTLSAPIEDLLCGTHEVLFEGSSTASIVNLGKITAWDGDVFLISYQVDNKGSVNAPSGTVALGAGQEVLLRPQALEKIVIRPSLAKYENETTGLDNSGLITACQAELKSDGNAYAMAIKHTGAIDALGVSEHNGQIFLVAEGGNNGVYGSITAKNSDGTGGSVQILGDHIAVLENARIDASGKVGGGTVLIGGDKNGKNAAVLNAKTTYVDKNAVITADALKGGDGGKVILWADETTCFYGNISARGGENSGDGGFVEVSGLQSLDFRGVADRLAPQGNAGTLLLDPLDIAISNNADLNDTLVTPFQPTGSPSNLNKGTLIAALAGGNVIVQTAPGGVSLGNITVSPSSLPIDQIIYNSANSLTLDNTAASTAGSAITINKTSATQSTIKNNGNGAININAGFDININAGITTNGNVTFTTTPGQLGKLNIIGTTQFTGVNCSAFTATIDGDINITGGSNNFDQAIIFAQGATSMTSNSGNITITGGTGPNTSAGFSCNGPTCTVTAPAGFVHVYSGTVGSGLIYNNVGTMTVTALLDVVVDNAAGASPAPTAISGIASNTINAASITISTFLIPADIQSSGILTVNLTGPGDFTINAVNGGNSAAGVTSPTFILNAPNSNLVMNGITGVGAAVPLINSAFSGGITINVKNVIMNGNLGGAIIQSRNDQLTINASQAVTLNQASVIKILTFGMAPPAEPLLIVAGTNISIGPNAQITNNTSGTLTLVVDNASPFNTPPNIGPGMFINNGAVTATPGQLRIFTARRAQNTQAGTLNGGAFGPPGAFGVNTPIEHWGVWYPDPFVGPNYTVFYKEITAAPHNTPLAVNLFNQAAYEFLQNLWDYDVFWYWETDFTADYDHEAYDRAHRKGILDTSTLVGESTYRLLRKSYKEQNGKVISLFH